MKKIINRVLMIIPALLIQIGWYVALIKWLSRFEPALTTVVTVLAVSLVLALVVKREESNYKILWLIIIILFPFFGTWMFLFFGDKRTSKPLQRKIDSAGFPGMETNKDVLEALQKDNYRMSGTLNMLSRYSGLPVRYGTPGTFFPIGEDMFEDMLRELKTAEHSIYLEYFILERGLFWDSIVDILEEKVKANVDVRVIYDDLGSLATYSSKNRDDLLKKGIKCIAFNPMVFIKSSLNNRDHRKMMIIDNRVAYSGGINLADEYINKKVVHGHWKDIGFKLCGEPVLSFTYMFLEFWNAFSSDKISPEVVHIPEYKESEKDGYLISYYDSPSNKEPLSNTLYIDLLYQAKDYIWFYTPYLILGDSLCDALVRCAERGVDVRIVMPGIPDKKVIKRMGESYYRILLDSGVKIYEYESGFVHAKAVISDGEIGTVGSVNLDYRSLFLHYECNTVFYKNSMLESLYEDFEDTFKKSRKVGIRDTKKGIFYRMVDAFLRIIAPLC